MEVQKISEIFIKPSSPTPRHLKTYKISLFDQLIPPILNIPMILYYSNPGDGNLVSKRSMLLKQSLSETLTHYYSLAGRIKDILSIDCNDEGVCYVEAKANISLSEYLTQPDLKSLNSLFPKNAHWVRDLSTQTDVAMIQETTFKCGSLAIGVILSHMVMDGIALVSFLKCWAAIARKSSEDIILPIFEGPSKFPQHEAFPVEVLFPKQLLEIGKCATMRFVFDARTLADLKVEAMASGVEHPTRVEVVCAVLLESIATILNEKSAGGNKPNVFSFVVNLRQRATPPISESLLGNMVWFTRELCSPEENKRANFLLKLKELKRKIGGDFVKNILDGGFNKIYEVMKESLGEFNSTLPTLSNGINFVSISSWCNFGFYEVDFGWGKPQWVTCSAPSSDNPAMYSNNLILIDGGINKGVEAWLLMDREDLVLLEKHKPLLQCASINPSLKLYG